MSLGLYPAQDALNFRAAAQGSVKPQLKRANTVPISGLANPDAGGGDVYFGAKPKDLLVRGALVTAMFLSTACSVVRASDDQPDIDPTPTTVITETLPTTEPDPEPTVPPAPTVVPPTPTTGPVIEPAPEPDPTPAPTEAPATPTPEEHAAQVMKCIPFPIQSQSMFPPSFFENGPQPVWAEGEDLPMDQLEARMGSWLERYLAQSIPDDPDAQMQAIMMFINPDVKAKVQDPRLRAALLSYTGTFAEPFIDYVLNGTHENGAPILSHGILFRPYDNPVQGGSLEKADDGRAYIGINQNLRHEDPRMLAAIIIFELAHFPEFPGTVPEGAPTNGTYEEMMGAWLNGQYWAREIAKDPSLAGDPNAPANTVGQVLMNGEALLIINSNGLFGETDELIIPGGALNWNQYSDRFNMDDDRVTQAPPVLGQVLANLAGEDAPPPPADQYTRGLLDWVDQNVDDSTPEMLAAAQALNLDTSKTPVDGTAVPRD